jgi:hypothetical protein
LQRFVLNLSRQPLAQCQFQSLHVHHIDRLSNLLSNLIKMHSGPRKSGSKF